MKIHIFHDWSEWRGIPYKKGKKIITPSYSLTADKRQPYQLRQCNDKGCQKIELREMW